MNLTTAQLQTLKTDIANDGTLSAFPNNSDGNAAIAAVYNTAAAPTFFVYRTNIGIAELFNGIVWANFTPIDAVPTDTALNVAIWQARSLQCQGKQFNVQTLLVGQSLVNASKANTRAGLQDALTNIPSGASGAPLSAGWVTVRDTVLARAAARFEKLFASGGNGATAATAATMVIEGVLVGTDIENARNS